MYCIKCGKLKEECICNKSVNTYQNNKNNKGPIIALVIIISIFLVIGLVFLFVNIFGIKSQIDDEKIAKPGNMEQIKSPSRRYSCTTDRYTYFILNDDYTFTGERNYCAGYHDISGTYEVYGDVVKLIYDEDMGDGRNVEDYFYIESDTLYTYARGDSYIIACSGEDFEMEEE